jgi:F-type H+-transporting ATPase subunit delta
LIRQSIAKRYAKGLFGVGEKDGNYRTYLKEIETIVTLFEKEEKLKKALMLPLLEIEKRKEILSDLVKSIGLSLPLANVLTMLLEKNRMAYLPFIKEAYEELADEKEGRIRGTLWTAFPLEEALKARIADVLKQWMKKEVVLNIIEDRSLIGGIKINMRGTIIDGSIKMQLETLKENILKE